MTFFFNIKISLSPAFEKKNYSGARDPLFWNHFKCLLASEIQFFNSPGRSEIITLDLMLNRKKKNVFFHQTTLLKSNFCQSLNFDEKAIFLREKKNDSFHLLD